MDIEKKSVSLPLRLSTAFTTNNKPKRVVAMTTRFYFIMGNEISYISAKTR